MKLFLHAVAAGWLSLAIAYSDTLHLRSGTTVDGTVIRTNADEYLLLAEYGTFPFAKSAVKEIKHDNTFETKSGKRIPSFKQIVLGLSKQEWAANLAQIPATVIDKGVLKNVPYISFRCGDDYEVNIYGDLSAPAGVEAGVYRKLVNDEKAKRDCLNFVTSVLGQTADQEVIGALNLQKDLKQRDGMSFEVTPPTGEDAYNGWWISVYSESALDKSRASEKEMGGITVARIAVSQSADGTAWSADEMKLARPSQPQAITFTDSNGTTVTNATVVRVVDAAYLIWRIGAQSGMLRLTELPEDLRTRFGYDASRAAAAYAAEERRKTVGADAQSTVARTSIQASTDTAWTPDYSSSYQPSQSSSGRVYVRGYTRSDGTYVQPHTRSYPHRR